MKILLLAPIPLLLVAAGPAGAQFGFGRGACDHRAERSATLPTAGADLIRISAGAGSLRVEARPGLAEVRVRGEACASNERLLDEIQLRVERAGDELRIETSMPETGGLRVASARLDLVVEVPESLLLDVVDGSGDVEILGVGALRLRDGSGGVEVRDVRGDAEIDDGSGDLTLVGVRGDVRLRDSSGGMEIRDVTGSVLIERDSSGDIDVVGVGRDVTVERDSSGSISVRGVRGDFVVGRDGSGAIRHRDVAGTVRIPRRR